MPPPATEPGIADDPRALTILTTEHWGLLSARGLAYNEAFTRASMYLTFVSMSLVALTLLATATKFDATFLGIATLILGADFVAGLLTTLRMTLARFEDTRATMAVNRIRNAYLRISPGVEGFLVTSAHDDFRGMRVTETLGMRTSMGWVENLASSGLMVGVITVLIGGTFVFTLLVNMGVDVVVARRIGGITAIGLAVLAFGVVIPRVSRRFRDFETRFPTPPDETP